MLFVSPARLAAETHKSSARQKTLYGFGNITASCRPIGSEERSGLSPWN
jgi:hypothetical protein